MLKIVSSKTAHHQKLNQELTWTQYQIGCHSRKTPTLCSSIAKQLQWSRRGRKCRNRMCRQYWNSCYVYERMHLESKIQKDNVNFDQIVAHSPLCQSLKFEFLQDPHPLNCLQEGALQGTSDDQYLLLSFEEFMISKLSYL